MLCRRYANGIAGMARFTAFSFQWQAADIFVALARKKAPFRQSPRHFQQAPMIFALAQPRATPCNRRSPKAAASPRLNRAGLPGLAFSGAHASQPITSRAAADAASATLFRIRPMISSGMRKALFARLGRSHDDTLLSRPTAKSFT